MTDSNANDRLKLYRIALEEVVRAETRHLLRIHENGTAISLGLDPEMRLNNVSDAQMKYVFGNESTLGEGSFRVSASHDFELFDLQCDGSLKIADVVRENFNSFRERAEKHWCS